MTKKEHEILKIKEILKYQNYIKWYSCLPYSEFKRDFATEEGLCYMISSATIDRLLKKNSLFIKMRYGFYLKKTFEKL
tara:strand:+ start:409 stop:642 length:234 start_codon:yes stop_codon:yes gene_type:complete